jgi:hypothetical protein
LGGEAQPEDVPLGWFGICNKPIETDVNLKLSKGKVLVIRTRD